MQPSRNFDDLKFSSIHRRILLWGSGGPFLDGYVLVMIGVAEAAHEKRESVSNKIRKLKLSRFN